MYQKHLRAVLGVLVGPASDGDERRFSLQRRMMTSSDGERYRSAWKGFRLTGLKEPNGDGDDYDVCCLCAQDSFH